MVVCWFYRIRQRSWLALTTALIPLGLPLVVGAIAFGWYNWARFGSILETGFSYALAGPHLRAHLDELFSPVYIVQNLYNYLLNPFAVNQVFPFFYPIRGRVETIFPWQIMPEIYSAQAVTGLICAAPFTLLAGISTAKLFRNNQTDPSSQDSETISLHWMIISLLGSFMLSFVALLAFFWTAMRYAEDFMPILTLLSIIGFWYGYQALSPDSNKGKMYIVLGLILAGLSIITGTFLALSIYSTSGLL
jgi:hypothetical protein